MICGCGLSLLAACGDDELILPGERVDLRTDAPLARVVVENRTLPLNPGAEVINSDWSHLNGSVRHQIQHPALGNTLTQVWARPIGLGNGRKHRITASPVVAGETVYTLDSRARVTATSQSGQTVWTRDLTPSADASDDASGGGLSVSGDTLFVTTAFGELTAIDRLTGDVRWVQDFDSAATGAPTASNGVVYVVTRNQIGWAIDANDGRILWQVLGAPSASGIAGGPAPAISDNLVIFPFGSAQMIGAVPGPGTQIWSANVAGQRPGRAYARISDITADPVVVGDTIFAGNHAGRVAAFDATTGGNLWFADTGAIGPLWAAGGSLFLVSDDNRLVRLDAETGESIWAVDLPYFRKTRIARRETTFAHYGPVLAGGRLLVPSDDGLIRQFDPESGEALSSVALPGGAATGPVVAGGTLYVVTEDGELRAFR